MVAPAGHVYRFARVDESSNAFRARCVECQESIPLGTKWADLNGEPFRAYYCDPCKRAREAGDTPCPNCGQWQHASTRDCVHECRKRGFVQ